MHELCRQSIVGILSSADRCRPCCWLVFLSCVNQAAAAVGSEGIGGANPKVFCDRRPLCDLQNASTRTSSTIFRKSNRTYDRHATSSELSATEKKLLRSPDLTRSH